MRTLVDRGAIDQEIVQRHFPGLNEALDVRREQVEREIFILWPY